MSLNPNRRKAVLSLEYLEGRSLPSTTTGTELETPIDDPTNEAAQTSSQDAGQDHQGESPIHPCGGLSPDAQENETDQKPLCGPRDWPPPPKPPLPPPPLHKPPLPPPDLLRHFLTKLYLELLHRTPDEAGAEAWKQKLEEGTSREDVTRIIGNSQEARQVKIKALFMEHLGRDADEAGLNGWTQAMNNGATADEVKKAILGSQEYSAKRGGGDRPGFVKALYKDVLGREVDAAGAAAWAEQLEQGETTGSVADKVLASEECKKHRVKRLYEQLLHRPADEQGLNGFVHTWQNGVGEEGVRTRLCGSKEFYDRE